MHLAKIFRPIRWQATMSAGAGALPPVPGPATEVDWQRASRVETQPVTNTSPSGPELSAADRQRQLDEQGWMALLELVFEETQWPDAEP